MFERHECMRLVHWLSGLCSKGYPRNPCRSIGNKSWTRSGNLILTNMQPAKVRGGCGREKGSAEVMSPRFTTLVALVFLVGTRYGKVRGRGRAALISG